MPDLIPLRRGFLMAGVLCRCGCSDPPPTPPPPAMTHLGTVGLLTFAPDEDHRLQPERRFPLAPGLPQKAAIPQLADQLNRAYFTIRCRGIVSAESVRPIAPGAIQLHQPIAGAASG